MSHQTTPTSCVSLDAIIAATTRKLRISQWLRGFKGTLRLEGPMVIAHAQLGGYEEEVAEHLPPDEEGLFAEETLTGYEAMRECIARIEDAQSRAKDDLRPLVVVKALLDGVNPSGELATYGLGPATVEELRLLSSAIGAAISSLAGRFELSFDTTAVAA